MVATGITLFLLGVLCGMALSYWLGTIHGPMQQERMGSLMNSARDNEEMRQSPNLKQQPPPPEAGGIALGRSWRAKREELERASMPEPPTGDSVEKLEKRVEKRMKEYDSGVKAGGVA